MQLAGPVLWARAPGRPECTPCPLSAVAGRWGESAGRWKPCRRRCAANRPADPVLHARLKARRRPACTPPVLTVLDPPQAPKRRHNPRPHQTGPNPQHYRPPVLTSGPDHAGPQQQQGDRAAAGSRRQPPPPARLGAQPACAGLLRSRRHEGAGAGPGRVQVAASDRHRAAARPHVPNRLPPPSRPPPRCRRRAPPCASTRPWLTPSSPP